MKRLHRFFENPYHLRLPNFFETVRAKTDLDNAKASFKEDVIQVRQ